jgi:hypothetical protein
VLWWSAIALMALALAAACSEKERDRDDDDDDDGGGGAATTTTGTGNGGATTTTSTTTSAGGASACGHAGEAEPSDVAGITAAHNAIRCSLPSPGPSPPLAWSNEVAAVAQAYANELAVNCDLVHSGGSYGENLYASWGMSPSAADVVGSWAEELSCFSYGEFPDCCGCTCGHYTQIVWRDSVYLGCGKATCADDGEVWVCNYDPPGNYLGNMPY